MKKMYLLSFVLLATISWKADKLNLLIKRGFDTAEKQYETMLNVSQDLTKYPRTSKPDGSVSYSSIRDWTGGFWPGSLWYVFEYTKDEKWKQAAIKWTESLEKNQYNTDHHDLGFMMYCSYGNAYRLTGNQKYKDILVQSAKSLMTRYNPVTKTIKSWDSRKSWDGKTVWRYPVIIDNMMNLELLFFASKVTGDSVYRDAAINHALTTMKYHIRPDYSTYHVVNYDTLSGAALNRQTCQGYADNSTWARGQAWAIYGFTMTYRETKDKRFLETAEKLSDFYLNNKNLPNDKVPYWDFNVNQAGYTPDWKYDSSKFNEVPRDASAAAIVSSALFELSNYSKKGKRYKKAAVKILESLSSNNYLAQVGTNSNFLIKHSVGSIPHGSEIDVPLVYADYYYLEALMRYQTSLNNYNKN